MRHTWAELPLSSDHRGELRALGLTVKMVAERGYRTVEAPERFDLRDQYGFSDHQTGLGAFPGLLIPMYAPGEATPTHAQLKPARRRQRGAAEGPKYETPAGNGNRLDLHPSVNGHRSDPSVRLWITEGVKKADALTARGEVAIAIAGVWNWRGTVESTGGKLELGDFERVAWNGREVYIAFDSDAAVNAQVRTAMIRLAGLMRSRGAVPHYVIVPGRPEAKLGVDDYLATGGKVTELVAVALERLPDQDADFDLLLLVNALREVAAGKIAYVGVWRKTIRYSARTGLWQIDNPSPGAKFGLKAMRLARDVLGQLVDDGKIPEGRRMATGMIDAAWRTLLEEGGEFIVDPEHFDADPELLCCANGVLNLATGALSPHDPIHLMWRSTHVRWTGAYTGKPPPDVDTILGCVDPACRGYLQRYLGMASVGRVDDEALLVMAGVGENGKTTLLASVKAALGDYAAPVSSRLLTKRGSTEHLTIEADLFGKRFVWVSETDAGDQLDMERVKGLTGGDDRSARRMREDLWTFRPSHTLALATNYLPHIDRSDRGTWRRLRLLDFPYVYTDKPDPTKPAERKGDKGLRKRLIGSDSCGLENRQGMLEWIVEGARMFLNGGLGALPAPMVAATERWRESEDAMGTFFAERLVLDSEAWLPVSEVVNQFNEWLHETHRVSGDRGMFNHLRIRADLDMVVRQNGGSLTPYRDGKARTRCWKGITWTPTTTAQRPR